MRGRSAPGRHRRLEGEQRGQQAKSARTIQPVQRTVGGSSAITSTPMSTICAHLSIGAGLARGEMGEDSLDDLGSLDARDDAQRGATHATVFDVDVEDAFEPLDPAHRRGTRRMGLAGGLMGTVGDDVMAVFAVRGEHAVVSGEMGAGARHEGGEAGDAKSAGLPICTAGGCPEGVRHTDVPHEVDGVEYDMSGSVTEGVLESIHDLPAVIDREAFVRERWAGDIAAKAFERVPLMGSAARAAMQRKPRELSDALRERVGRDGAQGQGLAPGMGADCDAIVDDGAEELLETVGGFEVERGCERAPGRALGKARPNRNGAADDSPIKPAADAPRTRRRSRASPRRRPVPRTPRSARSLRAPPASSARRLSRTAPEILPEARAGRRRW